jgi:hypothetical protein
VGGDLIEQHLGRQPMEHSRAHLLNQDPIVQQLTAFFSYLADNVSNKNGLLEEAHNLSLNLQFPQ